MKTITAYHSTNDENFHPQKFLHVGSLEQAIMRGGKYLYRLEFRHSTRTIRAKDKGDWSKKALAGYSSKSDLVVYLNRHEGIPLEEFEAVTSKFDIDAIPDSKFKKLIPSAQDSWIIINPEFVKICERLEKP